MGGRLPLLRPQPHRDVARMFIVGELKPTRSARPKGPQPEDQGQKWRVEFWGRAASLSYLLYGLKPSKPMPGYVTAALGSDF